MAQPQRKFQISTTVTPPATGPRFTLMLVDAEPQVLAALSQMLSEPRFRLLTAGSLGEARDHVQAGDIDLALIDPNLPDGSGLALVDELSHGRASSRVIVMTRRPTAERAIQAIRCGASDIVSKPLDLGEVRARVQAAVDQRRLGRQSRHRIDRLRRICRKLNVARDEVARQVDIICNDLVTAYHDLAIQMNQVVQTSEYASRVGHDLDLELLLRRTLEFMLQKAGPTNAAVFLPSTGDEYSLGGYVNYDCTAESADMLLQHLADVVAPKLALRTGPVHITDNQTLAQWIGDDSAYLADSHVLAFLCQHKGETLAAIAMFRDGSQPFDATLLEVCNTVGPMLAEFLARIIRIHHRHILDIDTDTDTESDGGLGGMAA